MRGSPITRAASPDGRWAYTLYDGAGGHPFVHALDTRGRTARCIDLHGLVGYPSLYDVRLDVSAGGGTITVVNGAEPLAAIDTETFRVSEAADPATASRPVPAAPPSEPVAAGPRDEGFPWPFVAAPVVGVLLALGAVGALRLRRRRLAPI
jgi:hypothetical protein